MTSNRNIYGLSRRIPDSIKRAVRQRDGFGCICCGAAFPLEYDHFEPEFGDSREHDTQGILLLCTSCHRKKGNFLSRQTIERYRAAPKCKEEGFSRGAFDAGTDHPEIVFGSVIFRNVKVLIRILNDDVFAILPPEMLGGPFRINALLNDANGLEILRIIDNEIITSTHNWDVEVIGSSIRIRNAPRCISLKFRIEPPYRIVFELVDIEHKGIRIRTKEGMDIIAGDGFTKISGKNLIFQNLEVGVLVYENIVILGSNKIRRTSPCPCGSNKKYKKCHGSI